MLLNDNTESSNESDPQAYSSNEDVHSEDSYGDTSHKNESGQQREKAGISMAERTRMVATLGVMAAVSVILLVLGTLIAVNTVFFTAIASFLIGIIVIRYNFGAGLMLYVGSALLDLFINPDKFHVFLYLAMGGFILFGEGSYKILEKRIADYKKRNRIHIVVRFLIFFTGYTPLVIFLPRLFLTSDRVTDLIENPWIKLVLVGAGVIAFLVYDIAYVYVKRAYGKLFGRTLI